MPSRIQFESAGHVMSTEPSADETLANTGTGGAAGGKENIGTATSMTFDSGVAYFKCTDTLTSAVTWPGNPPIVPGSGVVNDGTESCATPYISVTGISIPSSWTVPATGKTESLSGIGAAPNNTGTGTYTIFPDVQIIIASGASTGGVGVAGSTKQTVAQIIGPVMELDNWVVPWTPTDKPPNFDGSDFGLARSSGYGNTAKGGPGIFYVTVELTYGLIFDTGGTSTTNKTTLNFKVGVINNYSNDRETYMAAYEKAYASLTKVPELSEWQT
jgi:hypothetical protein